MAFPLGDVDSFACSSSNADFFASPMADADFFTYSFSTALSILFGDAPLAALSRGWSSKLS